MIATSLRFIRDLYSVFERTCRGLRMTDVDTNEEVKVQWKTYHRRWFMLFIYICFEIGSTFQWIQYSIISDHITKYYNVENFAVDWTSTIFMAVFVPLIFPASYFMDKLGLRWPMILGTFGSAAGACIKIASVDRDLFWVTFVGQTLVAMSQIFMLTLPPVIAAVWFSEKEVSTACAIGVFGNQLGIIVGFFVPPMMVVDHSDIEEIGNDLRRVFYMSAGYNVAVFIITVLFFQGKPPVPPSPQQAMLKENAAGNEVGVFSILKRLLLNRSYVILLISYCVNQGVLNSLSTLLNQIVTQYSYEDTSKFAGNLGVVLIASGMVGTIVFGMILDKTRKYKLITFIVYASTLAGMIAVTYTLPTKSEVAVYLTFAFLGIFLNSYVSIAYDFIVEVTYPESEAMASGIISFAYQLFSLIATLVSGQMVRSIGAEWSNNTLSILLLIGTVLHLIIKPDLKRQAAYASTTSLVKEA